MSEPFIVPTASGILANILASACVELYRVWATESPELPPELDLDRINAAVASNASGLRPDSLLGTSGSALELEALTRFLTSRDMENLAHDAVALHILGRNPTVSTELSLQTSHLLTAYGMSREGAAAASAGIIKLLNSIAIDSIERIDVVQKGTKKTDEAEKGRREREAAYRHLRDRNGVRLADQLAVLVEMQYKDDVDIVSLERRVQQLRSAVSAAHATVTPPNLDVSRKVPIESIYVPPRVEVSMQEVVVKHGIRGRQKQRKFDLRSYEIENATEQFLANHPRVIILGNPGAGKTTFGQYVSRLICIKTGKVAEVALPVVLREQTEPAVGSAGIDVIEAVRVTARNRYQCDLKRSEVAFLCSSGRLLIVIDGLDEVANVQDRVSLTSSIEAFSAVYTRCRLMVTSRIVGYRQAPLDEAIFAQAVIAPFSIELVRRYALNWFRLDESLSRFQRDALVDSLVRESDTVADLRENPLLLSLMCGLYRHQRYIPRNRPQVFGSCAKLLFDTWDRRRSLRPAFEFDAHVQYLAHWIFSNPDLQAGVPEPLLVETAAEYLHSHQYRDRQQANLLPARSSISARTGHGF